MRISRLYFVKLLEQGRLRFGRWASSGASVIKNVLHYMEEYQR